MIYLSMTKIHVLHTIFFLKNYIKIIVNTASWQKIVLIKCISFWHCIILYNKFYSASFSQNSIIIFWVIFENENKFW